MVDNKDKKRKECGKVKWIAIFTLFAVLLAGGLFAKYISEHQQSASMTSSDFYFTSNYLDESEQSYDINDWQDGFDIELYNYDKDDKTKVSQNDIQYKVSVSGDGDWVCKEGSEGTLKTGTSDKKNKQTIHINPGNTAKKGNVFTVTVTTTSPYKRTISAKFTATSSDKPDYTIKDEGDGSVSLEILSNDYKGDVNITWNQDKLDPDSTNKYMKTWTDSDQKGTITVQKNTTYHLLFFKNTTGSIQTTIGSGTNIKLPTT